MAPIKSSIDLSGGISSCCIADTFEDSCEQRWKITRKTNPNQPPWGSNGVLFLLRLAIFGVMLHENGFSYKKITDTIL